MRKWTIVLATVAAAALTVGALPFDSDEMTVAAKEAKKAEQVVKCPKKVGGMRNHSEARGDGHLQCFYMRKGQKDDSGVRLAVHWRPDEPGRRSSCWSRDPQPVINQAGGPEALNVGLRSPTHQVSGTYYVDEGKHMSVGAAEAGLLKMIKAAEKVAHPCVPADAPITVDGFTCPLVIGDTYVREDWYGDEPPAIRPPRDATRNDYGFACNYDHAYSEEGGIGRIELEWLGGTPDEQELEWACAENEVDFEEWMKLDLDYIDNWSLREDLWILAKTLPAVLLGRGAY